LVHPSPAPSVPAAWNRITSGRRLCPIVNHTRPRPDVKICMRKSTGFFGTDHPCGHDWGPREGAIRIVRRIVRTWAACCRAPSTRGSRRTGSLRHRVHSRCMRNWRTSSWPGRSAQVAHTPARRGAAWRNRRGRASLWAMEWTDRDGQQASESSRECLPHTLLEDAITQSHFTTRGLAVTVHNLLDQYKGGQRVRVSGISRPLAWWMSRVICAVSPSGST